MQGYDPHFELEGLIKRLELELKTKYPDAVPTIKSRAADERAKLKCPAR